MRETGGGSGLQHVSFNKFWKIPFSDDAAGHGKLAVIHSSNKESRSERLPGSQITAL